MPWEVPPPGTGRGRSGPETLIGVQGYWRQGPGAWRPLRVATGRCPTSWSSCFLTGASLVYFTESPIRPRDLLRASLVPGLVPRLGDSCRSGRAFAWWSDTETGKAGLPLAGPRRLQRPPESSRVWAGGGRALSRGPVFQPRLAKSPGGTELARDGQWWTARVAGGKRREEAELSEREKAGSAGLGKEAPSPALGCSPSVRPSCPRPQEPALSSEPELVFSCESDKVPTLGHSP